VYRVDGPAAEDGLHGMRLMRRSCWSIPTPARSTSQRPSIAKPPGRGDRTKARLLWGCCTHTSADLTGAIAEFDGIRASPDPRLNHNSLTTLETNR
jgi:hypothetical protein